MVLMSVCGALVVAGLAAIVRWGGLDVEAPPAPEDSGERSPRTVARRYLWNVTVAVAAGAGSGVLLAGAGGRLAMRLLAVTAGDAAQGRVTEADQVVGDITTSGTVGFIVFAGLFFGMTVGALYMLLRRWLPRGRWGGLAFGGLLLVLAATRSEPLRAGNPDFNIVGPGWLSVAVFSAIVVAHGMCVAAVAGRYSRVLPLVPRGRRRFAYAPLVSLAPMTPVVVPLVVVGLVAVAAARVRPLVEGLRSHVVAVGGRVVLAVAALVALPGSVASLADIVGRAP